MAKQDSLHWHAVLIRRVARRLATELLVALNRTHVRHFDNNGLSERTSVVGRVGVLVACEGEAASTGITSTETRAGSKRQLTDGSGVARGSFATSWKMESQNYQSNSKRVRVRTWRATARVHGE